MELYVQSCGADPEHDYAWLHIVGDSATPAEPPFVRERALSLVQSEEPSVLIGRYGSRLLLFVSGMTASNRVDYQRRRVRNTLACIGDNLDEANLSGIAMAALRGSLDRLIDAAVKFDSGSPTGFSVAPIIAGQLQKLAVRRNSPAPIRDRIGKNVARLRGELADDLEIYQLPEREGPLVVVTRNKDPETLIGVGVWQGLTNLVDAQLDDTQPQWRPITHPGIQLRARRFSRQRIVLGLAGLLLITLGIMLVFWALKSQRP